MQNNVIEDTEDDVDKLPDSDFSKAAAIIFDRIDNGKSIVLLLSKFVEFIETLGEDLHNKDLASQLRKVDPN